MLNPEVYVYINQQSSGATQGTAGSISCQAMDLVDRPTDWLNFN
jgi:hypothetical protein